ENGAGRAAAGRNRPGRSLPAREQRHEQEAGDFSMIPMPGHTLTHASAPQSGGASNRSKSAKKYSTRQCLSIVLPDDVAPSAKEEPPPLQDCEVDRKKDAHEVQQAAGGGPV